VVDEVRRFGRNFLIRPGGARQRGLHAFLADLLGPWARSLAVQLVSGSALARSAMVRSRRAIRPRPGASSAPKQLVVPRWQAGPIGRTARTRASPSQSGVIDTTVSRLPEVSPLRHRPPREREKKVASPDSIVSSRAARSI
jgi:hypothetical protein